ncbi:putative ATP-grasp-modified RiPP [Streptomyces sp. NPDC020681]|uniref:putative ATP-grasp-modified RiPP n=1 Tax=Streptomyces sp. NPDC020681 TaxID=3365083 RepID=UPI003789D14F
MKQFVWRYATGVEQQQAAAPPFEYDDTLQLNVLADGRRTAKDKALMLQLGTTTSTAGSATHFDD